MFAHFFQRRVGFDFFLTLMHAKLNANSLALPLLMLPSMCGTNDTVWQRPHGIYFSAPCAKTSNLNSIIDDVWCLKVATGGNTCNKKKMHSCWRHDSRPFMLVPSSRPFAFHSCCDGAQEAVNIAPPQVDSAVLCPRIP